MEKAGMLIDAHAHLDSYGSELESVLADIVRHRILTISTSMDLASWQRNLLIGEKCELVVSTFGVHPWNASEYAGSLEELRGAIEQSPMLGEIGLDHQFIKDTSQYPAQQKVFEFFLEAAQEQGKIVNIHTTGAEKEVLHLLDRYAIQRTIIHWYSGPLDVLSELIARRCYFTVGVEVNHSAHIRAIARELPLELLLTETDNPGGFKWLTGTPGMPLLIRDVIRALAELKDTTTDHIIQTVQINFAQLIRGDPWLSEVYARFFAEQPDDA